MALPGVLTGRISYFRLSVKEPRLALSKDWVPSPDCGRPSTEDKDKGKDGIHGDASQPHRLHISSTLSFGATMQAFVSRMSAGSRGCARYGRVHVGHICWTCPFFFKCRMHSLFIPHVITSRQPLWWQRFWPLIGASSPVPSPLFSSRPLQLFVLHPVPSLWQLSRSPPLLPHLPHLSPQHFLTLSLRP